MAVSHLFPNIRPSLDLNFAATKRLDPRITFSRSSSGSYIDREGAMQYAGNDIARFDHNGATLESLGLLVEEARTNRTPRSERLGLSTGNWFTANAFIADNQRLAPDGTFTASRLVPNTTNAIHYVADGTGASLSGTATVSVFAKADGYNFIYLAFDYASGDGLFPGSAYFDLSTGQISLGASTTGSIQQLPNGWYRCTISATSGSTVQANPFVAAANSLSNFNFAGNGTSGILLWGFQFESGSFPTSYIPTPATFTSRASSATYYDANGVIQTAGIDVARSAAYFPDSNGVMRPAGLLLEAAGTNLALHSEALGSWTNNGGGIAITSNVEVAPDGTTTADRLAQSAVTNATRALYNLGASVRSGQRFTTSFWMKRVSGTDPEPTFIVNGIGGGPGQAFTVTTSWKRYSFTWTAINDGGTYEVGSIYFSWDINGAANNNVYSIWGFQVEQNSYATSYIPTTTATVTRAADTSTSATVTRSADVAQITGTNFSSWYNQSEGTLLSVHTPARKLVTPSKAAAIWAISNGTDSERIWANAYDTFSYAIANTSAGLSVRYDDANFVDSVEAKSAYAWKSNDVNWALNGTIKSVDTSASVPSVSRMYIGANAIGEGTTVATFKRLTYWPVRLGDLTLQVITR